MVRITGHLNIKLSILPGPGFGKSGQAVDRDNVDPVLNGEVWFGRGRHFRLHPGRVHRLLPYGHLSQSLVGGFPWRQKTGAILLAWLNDIRDSMDTKR